MINTITESKLGSKVLFHLIACDPPNQPSLPGKEVHAEIPAFEICNSPKLHSKTLSRQQQKSSISQPHLLVLSWISHGCAGLGILHLTSSLHHQAASHSPHFPGACCSAALVTFTTEDVPMWSFLRATCKEFGLIARHTDLFGASPCVCLSLSPSQLLCRHTDPSPDTLTLPWGLTTLQTEPDPSKPFWFRSQMFFQCLLLRSCPPIEGDIGGGTPTFRSHGLGGGSGSLGRDLELPAIVRLADFLCFVQFTLSHATPSS